MINENWGVSPWLWKPPLMETIVLQILHRSMLLEDALRQMVEG